MAIHHTQQKAAESMGFSLNEHGEQVRAFHPSTGVQVFGVSAKDALSQMVAYTKIYERDAELRYQPDADVPTIGRLRPAGNHALSAQAGTPIQLYALLKSGGISFEEPEADDFEEDEHGANGGDAATPLIKRNEKGVPYDGAVAYKEGITAIDNPYPEGTEEGDEWDTQWDQAADGATEEEEDDKHGGSVVATKYRNKYKDEGHPTHCGDWLANLLNNYCVGKKETDLAMLEHICSLNGVDTSKYNRTTPGWQGRVRMTGRNLLARKIFLAKTITVPNQDGGADIVLDVPADWLSAQRFNKPKGE